MSINALQNTSFSSEVPFLQMAWDSTSIGVLKECPRKYFYTIVLGRQTREDNVHLTFGQHYHRALEIYDHHKSRGLSHEEAQLEAVRYCYEATIVRLPSGKWRPWISDDTNKNRFTLLRSVVWYLEQFAEDPLHTVQLSNGKPAVELSFRYETDIQVPTVPDSRFWICGHIDRLVELDGSLYFLDRKTTKHTLTPEVFGKFTPDNQMSLYDFSSTVIWQVPVKGGILDVAQVAGGFTRFARGFLPRTPGMRQEWYADLHFYLEQAAQFAEVKYWPMNDKSCGNYGGCPFRAVCAKGPEVREQWLKNLTVPRIWDPLRIRGDI